MRYRMEIYDRGNDQTVEIRRPRTVRGIKRIVRQKGSDFWLNRHAYRYAIDGVPYTITGGKLEAQEPDCFDERYTLEAMLTRAEKGGLKAAVCG